MIQILQLSYKTDLSSFGQYGGGEIGQLFIQLSGHTACRCSGLGNKMGVSFRCTKSNWRKSNPDLLGQTKQNSVGMKLEETGGHLAQSTR